VTLAQRASGPLPPNVGYASPWGDALAMLDEVRPDVRIVHLDRR